MMLVSAGDVITMTTNEVKHKQDMKKTLMTKVPNNKILTQSEFENFFLEEMPYLNPHLKISDLVRVFGINRSYLSNFINKTYGLNFNQYVNLWRIKEVERISHLEKDGKKKLADIVAHAGFGSISSYWRAKKLIDEREMH